MTANGELDWQSLARVLADGFESLLKEVDHLSTKGRDLDAKLRFAHQEYLKLAAHPALDDGNHAEREAVSRRLATVEHSGGPGDHVDQDAYLQQDPEQIEVVKKGLQAYKSVKAKTLGNASSLRCPVSGVQSRPADMEQDFTTPGRTGDLGCPFAKMTMQTNGVPTPPQEKFDGDPIKAEFHVEKQSMSSRDAPSATGAASKCPIRYLDQHSPEEVAKYFENHKHEIPRSHEICVKRYQRNSESIRELDSKYGNLVSMIQGLGVKHQQYLPGKEGEMDLDKTTTSNGAVSKWADGVSRRSEHPGGSMQSAPLEGEGEPEEIRQSHFQRPLREIRVGESPSRPWGISVPLAPERAESPPPAPVKEPNFDARPLQSSEEHKAAEHPPEAKTAAARCPFDHRKVESTRKGGEQSALKTASESQSSRTPMVFNGPVFFGYSAEQAMKMMNAMSNDP